jgi:PST family polysaccharide transporter
MKFFKKNLKIAPDKQTLVENFFSLSVLQGANYLLPLLVLPYLVRVLGIDKYGLVVFAQAFAQYFIIFTDFGFDLSATRNISVHRDDKKQVNDIFNTVMFIKFGLMLIGLILFLSIIFGFTRFRQEWAFFLFSYGAVIGNMFFPLWFFQGMEKMKYITALNILSKLIFTIAVFLVIRKPSHYFYVPLLYSSGFIVSGIWAQWITIKKFGLSYALPSRTQILEKFKESSQFFASRVSLSIFTSSNVFVLGLFTTNEIVGYFAAAEKLFSAIKNAYQPLVNTLYPYVSKMKNVALFKKVFKTATLFNFLLSIAVFFLAYHIVEIIFGKGMQLSAHVLQIFAVISVYAIPSILLGFPFLAAMGYPRYANSSVIIGSLVHLIGLLILVLTGTVNIYSVVVLVSITEFVIFSIRIRETHRKKLWNVH